MKKILVAEQLDSKKENYLDPDKNIYNPMPVFPFLTEEQIEQELEGFIDPEAFAAEVAALKEASKSQNCQIVDTSFIICLLKWEDAPEIMKMLTVMREWAFRNEGGGVGSNDYDDFDFNKETEQLVILDPEYTDIKGAIIGGYRYIIHNKGTYEHGPMGDHFHFSENWKTEQWIELGRSFINPYFQNKDKRYSIDYVLHGLGYIFAQYPDSKGYFGKVTLYNLYEQTKADEFFLAVANEYFAPSKDCYVFPEDRVKEGVLTEDHKKLLDRDILKGLFFILRGEYKLNMVRIMAVYNRMVDLRKMLYFGAFRHNEFGNTTEMGIAIKYEDIYPVIKEKFVEPYAG
ncbi:GNAT family N-acyltransferase [Algivirga pacifica]|uniref:GNAT family N-acetyltransferase n=1 Tax=Algivirga pacifica TaxID=1162670 RepID=A0ABP9D8D9_9BACT